MTSPTFNLPSKTPKLHLRPWGRCNTTGIERWELGHIKGCYTCSTCHGEGYVLVRAAQA